MTVRRIALNTLALLAVVVVAVTLFLGLLVVPLNGGPESYVNVPMTWTRALAAGVITGGITAYFYLLSLLKAKALSKGSQQR